MALRVRLTGIEIPGFVMKTIHRSIFLDSTELRDHLPPDILHKMFPKGVGIHFNLDEKTKILLLAEGNGNFHLDEKPLTTDKHHALTLENSGVVLKTGESLMKLHLFHSYF
ncbi:MAG: hypothetical protein ACD_5C00100G0002 [uncultured bacterium]|nr:MAG: hypothetical protein ACD_5C00100G0002 [uncultured bacterium]